MTMSTKMSEGVGGYSVRTGDMRPSRPGRGRKTTLAGKAKACAQGVLAWAEKGDSNRQYNMAYFGKAMRGHVEAMRQAGETMSLEDWSLVSRAESCVRTYCDGKDCSFVVG